MADETIRGTESCRAQKSSFGPVSCSPVHERRPITSLTRKQAHHQQQQKGKQSVKEEPGRKPRARRTRRQVDSRAIQNEKLAVEAFAPFQRARHVIRIRVHHFLEKHRIAPAIRPGDRKFN
jgi:hypothetical protein